MPEADAQGTEGQGMSALLFVRKRHYMIVRFTPVDFIRAILVRAFKYKAVYRGAYLEAVKNLAGRYSGNPGNTFRAIEDGAGYGLFNGGKWEIDGLKKFEMTNTDYPHSLVVTREHKNYMPETSAPFSLFWCCRQSFNTPADAMFCDCCGKYGTGKTIKARSDIYGWERRIKNQGYYWPSKYETCMACYNKIKGLLKRMDAYNATKQTLTNLRVEIRNGQNQQHG